MFLLSIWEWRKWWHHKVETGVWLRRCSVVYPAHFSRIKSISPILLQILHSVVSDGYITAYKWMNHNWFNPLSLYNWGIIEFFPFFMLLAVTVLNIFVCKSHPSPSPFLHAWSSDYLNVLTFTLLTFWNTPYPEAKYPQCLLLTHLLSIPVSTQYRVLIPELEPLPVPAQHLEGPAFWCFNLKQDCHHTAHFSLNRAS